MSDNGVRSDQGADEAADAYKARLRALADAVEEADEAVDLLRKQRDEIVVEVVEAGYSTREAGRWARISQSRVSGILARH